MKANQATTPCAAHATPSGKSGRRLIIRLLLVVIVLAIIVWRASLRSHAGPAVGKKFNTSTTNVPATLPTKTLRLATFNIHSGRGTDNRTDLDRIAGQLQNVDLVGLNEVRGAEWFGKSNQACILGEKLSMPWLFAPTEMQWGRADFGNAALCRLPIDGWLRIPLPIKRHSGMRNILLLRVIHQDKPVNVIITHIVSTERDPRQLHAVIDLFLSLKEPAILMGDLNNRLHDPLLRTLLDRPDVHTAIDHTLPEQNFKDWIIFRGLVRLDSKIYPVGASDHPTLHVELAWPKDKELGSASSTQTDNNN